jgi:hypothetical protein
VSQEIPEWIAWWLREAELTVPAEDSQLADVINTKLIEMLRYIQSRIEDNPLLWDAPNNQPTEAGDQSISRIIMRTMDTYRRRQQA